MKQYSIKVYTFQMTFIFERFTVFLNSSVKNSERKKKKINTKFSIKCTILSLLDHDTKNVVSKSYLSDGFRALLPTTNSIRNIGMAKQ